MNYLPRVTVAAVFGGLALVASAQSSAPASAPGASSTASPPAQTEAIVLSPFTVESERDYGYRSGASSTGTGLAGLIKDTPLNISVVSRELMEDQGGNQLVDILRNASSVGLHVKDEGVVLVRGYSGPKFVNGLPAGQGFPLYDVDRVEVVKGPNAVFAGLSNAGGTVNMIRMNPSFSATGSLSGEIGDYDHSRVVLKTSGPLIADKLAYLFVFGATDEKSSIDYMFTDERYYSGALTFRPLPNLTITSRYGDLEREAGRRPYLTVSNPAFQAADKDAMVNYDAKGLARPASAPQLENNAVAGIVTGRTAPEDVISWTSRTFGANVPPFTIIAFEDFFGRSSFNYNGPEGRDSYFSQLFNTEIEYIVNNDLAFRLAYQDIESGRLRREFNGFRPVAGQRIRSNSSDFNEDTDSRDTKLEATYQLDLGAFGKQSFLAGFQYSDSDRVARPSFGTAAINFNPRTDPVPRLAQMLQAQYGPNYVSPGATYVPQPHRRSLYGVLQSSFLEDRLRTMVGARVTENRLVNPITRTTTPQFGLLGRITPWLSAYASYSRTFLPQSVNSADLAAIRRTQGEPTSPGYVPPTTIPTLVLNNNLTGEGEEAGLKFDFADGVVTGTISYFKTEESDRLEVDTTNQVLYQLPGGVVRTPGGLTRARGVEAEFVWTPHTNYQALVSGSYFFEAEEITNPSDAREIGSHLEAVPEYTATFWNKYTFGDGVLKGAYIGGGITAIGEIGIHPSWTIPIRSDPVELINLIVGYRTKINNVPVDFRVNGENLADKTYLNGSFQYGEPRTFTGTVTIAW